MKPQCETTPECLEQLARVMREFGFTNMLDAIRSEYVHYYGERYDPGRVLYSPQFDNPAAWSFAIAKLEDRPVFLGDTVFVGRHKGIVLKYLKDFPTDPTEGVPALLLEFSDRDDEWASLAGCSWTPPKQTISIKVGDNEPVEVEKAVFIEAGTHLCRTIIAHPTTEAAEQFRKAMKPLVKE